MKSFNLGLIGALAIAGTAYGQQPPDIVVSDGFHGDTAMGTGALFNLSHPSGNNFNNTAAGYNALYSDIAGNGQNTATGAFALYSNTFGSYNTALGVNALYSNGNGSYNAASGQDALKNNTIGNYNIAMGYQAGFNLTTGSHNIDIGSPGVAAESGVIRIGTITGTTSTQSATYIAGIYNVSVSGSPVYIAPNGQLGVVVSSERFKTAIAPMGSNTSKLGQLRPVTFHLKTDPKGALQYGLIAEEVAKVYPELVIRDQAGRIDGVRYDELAPMLLNEVQQQHKKIAAQDKRSAAQDAEIGQLKQQLAVMQATLVRLQTKDKLVAQR
jgi:hypothetical protein